MGTDLMVVGTSTSCAEFQDTLSSLYCTMKCVIVPVSSGMRIVTDVSVRLSNPGATPGLGG